MAECWLSPCNVRHFNVITHFETKKHVVWRNYFTIKNGDIVFIYIGSPVKEIRYICRVINDHVDEETLQLNSYAIPQKKINNFFSKTDKYIEMELVYAYSNGSLKYEDLKRNGLGQVQLQARIDRHLLKYIVDNTPSEVKLKEMI